MKTCLCSLLNRAHIVFVSKSFPTCRKTLLILNEVTDIQVQSVAFPRANQSPGIETVEWREESNQKDTFELNNHLLDKSFQVISEGFVTQGMGDFFFFFPPEMSKVSCSFELEDVSPKEACMNFHNLWVLLFFWRRREAEVCWKACMTPIPDCEFKKHFFRCKLQHFTNHTRFI